MNLFTGILQGLRPQTSDDFAERLFKISYFDRTPSLTTCQISMIGSYIAAT